MKNINLIITSLCAWFLSMSMVDAQDRIVLTLDKTITLASDSSLDAFRSKNLYLANYWQYRTYKANRLPSLTLYTNPIRYNRDIVQRYDSEQNIDVYREQQSIYSSASLGVRQNFDLTGGTFFVDSELGFLRNFGDYTQTQYNSIPVRVGYRQDLIGYNPFKWEKKIEPLRYEKAKKELIFNMEATSERATDLFFELAMVQAQYDLAKKMLASSDTLYNIGLQRQKIAAISKADLLTLELDRINAQNTLKNADMDLKRAMFSLALFLNYDKNTKITLVLPDRPRDMDISVDDALFQAKENNPKFLDFKQRILESERDVDRARKESLFNASVNASIGFNQSAEKFNRVYKDLMQQDIVGVSISVPLVDWGVRKGKHNMAKNNLNVLKISSKQEELNIEEDVIMTVGDFNIQQDMISSAENALELASMAYDATKQRFLIGKADLNSLTLSQNREQSAQQNYIQALRNYWKSYFKIRKLTLYDFDKKIELSREYDFKLEN